MKKYNALFEEMVTLENLFSAWTDFAKGKRKKKDVLEFEENLEDNIVDLYQDLIGSTYVPSSYEEFFVHDPKRRHIHKAKVRDRIVHRLLYDLLTKIYEPVFIAHSYSARKEKGTHKAVREIKTMIRACSGNYVEPCFVLKCDIAKFFDSVDHEILMRLFQKRILDERILYLLKGILDSADGLKTYVPQGKGMPLGNLTSQIFSNIYLHELDYFIKQKLGVKNYVRYADDFFVVHSSQKQLREYVRAIAVFLKTDLQLFLHPRKVMISSVYDGIDALGYILFPFYRGLRGRTKKRMLKKILQLKFDYLFDEKNMKEIEATIASYQGIMKHADCFELSQAIMNSFTSWKL